MFLFQALHTYQREKAQEALIENKVVLADRWNASFWVYHQELGPLKNCKDYLEVLDNIAFCGLVPDVTFLLDLPVTIAFQRRDGRGPRDTFEEETYEVFSLAKDAYLKMAEKDKSWVVIDASGSKREVHSAICKKIRTYILK
jgi:dTMP kinase